MEIVRQKNVATRIVFPIVDADGDLVTGAASLDSEIDQWADGANPSGFADCTNEATEIGTTGIYYLNLTQTEMNEDYIVVQVKTATAGAKTQVILISTMVGDPLNIATTDDGGAINVASGVVEADVLKVGGTTQTAGDLKASLNTIDDFIDTEITDIQNRLPAALVGGRIDANVGAISSDSTAADNLEAEYDNTGFKSYTRRNTAQAGAAGTITLDASASATDDLYNGQVIAIISGTGAGQARRISDYVGSTKVATIEPNWATNPSSDSVFVIVPLGRVDIAQVKGTDQTAGDLAAMITTVDDFLDTEVAAIKAKTDNLPTDPADASDIASSFSTVNTKLDTIDDFLDTEVAAIKAKTDNLPSDPADASDISSSFSTVNTKLDTIDDFLDTEIAAIKAKTDLINVLRTNTAQAGAAGTITLDASASAVDDFYNNAIIEITAGTGVGQSRIISDYVGSTKVATVNGNWATNPSSDSVFQILAFGAIPGATAPTAAEVADAVWDEDATAHQTQGTFGQAIGDPTSDSDTIWGLVNTNLNTTVSSRASQTSVDTVDDFLDTEIAAIKAKTDNLPADPADASDIASSFSTVNTKLDTIDDFLDTEVAAIKAKTDNLPTDPADASDIASSFTTVNTKLDTIDDFLDTEIAAIKAKTDNLPVAIKKNTALSNFEFLMVDTSGDPATGLTVTAQRSIDGAAFGACANSVSEVANGVYKINLAAGDLNGDVITLKFTASGAKQRTITIVTNT